MSIFRLGLELSGPVDVGFPLRRIFVLEIKPRNLEVSFELVIHAVLLLSSLQGDPDENLRGLAPILFALVDVGQMLTNDSDLILERNNSVTKKGYFPFKQIAELDHLDSGNSDVIRINSSMNEIFPGPHSPNIQMQCF